MKIQELFESATAESTSSGDIASTGNSPHVAVGSVATIKRWSGNPGKMGKSPKHKAPKSQNANDNPVINPNVGNNLIA